MSIQIKKKFLRSQSVDGSKVLFLNEDSFKALKADGSEAALFKLDSDNKFQLLEMPRVFSDPTHVNELARKSYVDAGDAAEALARAAADAAEQAAREDADSAIRAEFAAADALVLLESKDYTDEKVSEEAAIRSAEDADIRYDFAAADLVEKTAREAADQLLRDDLDSEIATRASEDVRVLSESKAYTDVEKARAMAAEAAEAGLRVSEDIRVLGEAKAYTDQEVLAEESRAMAVEAELRSDLDQEIADRIADVNVEEARALAAEQYLQEQIWTEQSRAQLAEEALQSEIDTEIATREAEDLTFFKHDGSRAMTGALDLAENAVQKAKYINFTEFGTSVGNINSGSSGVTVTATQAVTLLGNVVVASAETEVLISSVSGPATLESSESDVVLSSGSKIVNVSEAKITNLAEGTNSTDAVNKSQLDASLVDAKEYTDMSIASVIDAAPEAYNTLREIAEYIASDQTATSQILSQLYDHETRLDVIEGTGEGSIAKAEADAMAYTDAEKARAMAAEAGLQSDIDAEESRAMAREAQLQSEIDAEELLRASEDIRVLGEAKDYTDAEKARAMGQEAAIRSEFAAADAAIRLDLDDLDGYAQELRFDLDQEIADRIADVNAEEALRASEDIRILSESKAYTDAEKARAMAAEAAEAALRASEDIRVLGEAKAYTDVEVLAEKTRAMAVEASLQSEIDAEEALRASEDIRILGESKTYTDAEVLAEETRAMAREAELQSEIDAEEALRASEDIRVLFESKEYTNQKVAAVIDSAPEMLDTLRELAEALGNDENFATSVTGYIAAAKEEAKQYAESLSNDFGARFAVDSFTVSSQTITDNYIELSHKAFSMSIVFSIDRLMMLEGEDYEVSVMNGKTRLTFAGSMLQGEAEALALGDKLRVRYLKDVRS